MKYSKVQIVSILLFIICSCNNSDYDTVSLKSDRKYQLRIFNNDSVYVVLSNEKHQPFSGTIVSAKLSSKELIIIDSLLFVAVESYNQKAKLGMQKLKSENPNFVINDKDYIIDIFSYNFQLVPVINSSNEKIVWINSFCHKYRSDKWKEGIPHIFDGGNCFFNLKVNINKKQNYSFKVNGSA